MNLLRSSTAPALFSPAAMMQNARNERNLYRPGALNLSVIQNRPGQPYTVLNEFDVEDFQPLHPEANIIAADGDLVPTYQYFNDDPANLVSFVNQANSAASAKDLMEIIAQQIARIPVEYRPTGHQATTMLRMLANADPRVLKALNSPAISNTARQYSSAILQKAASAGLTNDQMRDGLAQTLDYAGRLNMGPTSTYQVAGRSAAIQKAIQRRQRIGFPQLNLKQGYAYPFPQWGIGQTKKIQKRQQDRVNEQNLAEAIRDPANRKMRDLHTLSPNAVFWSAALNKWQGTGIDQLQSKLLKRQERISNKMESANTTLKTRITPQQVQTQIPKVVAEIVAANDAFSTVGFGPISEGGSDLYAGRWLDEQTGRVRVLPSANQKFLNPISLPQKLGYLQAKILNHWNAIIDTQSQYNKLKQMGPTKYKNKVVKAIKNGLNISDGMVQQANNINNKIRAYALRTKMTPTFYLISRIPAAQLVRIAQLLGPQQMKTIQSTSNLSLVQKNDLSAKLIAWQQALNTAVEDAQTNVNNDARLTPQNKSKMLVQLNSAYLSMVSGPTSRITRALTKLRKINSIPDNMTPETMMKVAQQYQEDSKAVKQTLSQFVGNLSSQQLSGLVTVAKDFQLGAIKNDPGAFQQAQSRTLGLLGEIPAFRVRQPINAPKLREQKDLFYT